MQVQQFVNDFNKLTSNTSVLSYTEEIVLANKLKLILPKSLEELSSFRDVELFFQSVHNLLANRSNMKSGLLETCLDILLANITSPNSRIKGFLLSDSCFPPVVSLLNADGFLTIQ